LVLGIYYAWQKAPSNLPRGTFLKYVLVLFAIILALIPAVYAEDDKWIDKIG